MLLQHRAGPVLGSLLAQQADSVILAVYRFLGPPGPLVGSSADDALLFPVARPVKAVNLLVVARVIILGAVVSLAGQPVGYVVGENLAMARLVLVALLEVVGAVGNVAVKVVSEGRTD